ncbi:gamma-parvin [Myxocyprinus asiaticus]|uniref:gamma-parvin n=1 Tax=Myxocyprinus asiaticus TaxID=70543 RepID=UPI002223C18C|nr:gamma-parvin [Myxocyprinus asiaticus]XP_051546262.1 gamma-parvin [Myxocyprinus asiaticus]
MADCRAEGCEEEKDNFSGRQGGQRRLIIQPASLDNPKLSKLKEVLVEWTNRTLKDEHIVVRSLEEDLYDGLVLHHLLRRLAGVQLQVDEIALSAEAQVHKLEVILAALNETLEINEEKAKWSVKLIHSRDLLATMHLLVSMVRCFQPDLVLPANVSVEVIQCEVTKSGIKSDKQTEFITFQSNSREDLERESNKECPIDELFKLEEHKIETVKKAILHFVNKNISSLGLNVTDLEKQFADGVILLLLIGQLEGFFIPLCEFHLCPVGFSEMLHNVTLALDLLIDRGLPVQSVNPEDIVSQDVPATVKVLYYLFRRHKNK